MSLTAVGFTTVFPYCTMSRSAECCCSGEHGDNGAVLPIGVSLDDARASCNRQIVAGGLAPVALSALTEVSVKAPGPDIVTLDLAFLDVSVSPSLSFFAHADDVAPPKVDLYARCGAFLI